MGDGRCTNVLIVGAGSTGINIGYILSLAGANITFLIRAHRAAAMSKPQKLYSYNDDSLTEYSEYRLATNPSSLQYGVYDYILVTIDGTALRSCAGTQLIKRLSSIVVGSHTKMIFSSAAFNLLPWVRNTSGLPDEQLAVASHAIHVYSPKTTKLPLHSPTSPNLLADADYAYADRIGYGIAIADSNITIAKSFTELWNASRVSKAIIVSIDEYGLSSSLTFAAFAASQVLGWPNFKDIDAEGYIWKILSKAVREIQQLSIHGEAGQEAARSTTPQSLLSSWVEVEKQLLPLDLAAFYRCQHDGKFSRQTRDHLRECMAFGRAEGKSMIGLQELLQQVEKEDWKACLGRLVPAAWI